MNRMAAARLACAALLPLLLGSSGDAPPEPELRVKATFVFNFATFASWPVEKLGAGAPLYLCVQGAPAMGAMLAEVARGRDVGGHAIEVLQAPHAEALRRCHVVYVGARHDDAVAAELAALAGHRVLSVHEAGAALPDGVIRLFLSDGRRVLFEVNTAAAARAQVALSAKLLEVSQIVTR